MHSHQKLKRILAQADSKIKTIEDNRLAQEATAWIRQHSGQTGVDAHARWLGQYMQAAVETFEPLTDENEAHYAIAAHEKACATALAQLGLGEFSDDDARRLTGLYARMPHHLRQFLHVLIESLPA